MNSGTADGLLQFLNWTKEKGLVNASTADSRRSAAQQILEIHGDGWHELDVRVLDADEQFDRFSRLRSSKYSPSSLNTYGSRFRKALAQYREYLANPAGFRVAPQRSGRGAKEKSQVSSRPGADTAQPPRATSPSERAASAGRALITYPFPLQSDELAYVQLPLRVSAADAERLCAFIRSIAIASD